MNALALDRPHPVAGDGLEQAGAVALIGVAGALQFSIALAQILLLIALVCWVATLIVKHERVTVPQFFLPLAAYAGATLVSAAFSSDPRTSLVDCKQLVLFLLVPAVYRLINAQQARTLLTVVLTCAAVSAAFGVVQYGILHYDQLSQRPQGTLGHYMTYSGLLMMVIAVAVARLLFDSRDRTWAAAVLPALAVAVALTSTRSAWVGACTGVALLFALKDFRLFAVLPIVAAVFFALAPGMITKRFVSMFDNKDPTRLDRVAMVHEGERMIAAHPLTGVGPNMVEKRYADYRGNDAVNKVNPHLHNNPLQIAAERGLPALALWLWFIAALCLDLQRRFVSGSPRVLAAAALAVTVALLTAGLFEYNFGDSEVLMLFLIVTTLPAAADARLGRESRVPRREPSVASRQSSAGN
ncbi:MAG TPA: O-antigen ligase family protein [Vicinamibacterales bacterium]|nr:O-antigen ligase family protein [Vicinamibacterales bacterium]